MDAQDDLDPTLAPNPTPEDPQGPPAGQDPEPEEPTQSPLPASFTRLLGKSNKVKPNGTGVSKRRRTVTRVNEDGEEIEISKDEEYYGMVIEADLIDRVFDLARRGKRASVISRETGLPQKVVQKVIKRELELSRRRNLANMDRKKTMQVERIEKLIDAVWDCAMGGNCNAVKTLTELMKRESELLGLDAPAKNVNMTLEASDHDVIASAERYGFEVPEALRRAHGYGLPASPAPGGAGPVVRVFPAEPEPSPASPGPSEDGGESSTVVG